MSKLAHCSVPISDTKIYPETYIRTDQVHCQICGSKKNAKLMLLCDVCNKGFHTFCIPMPLPRVPLGGWRCDIHKVTFLPILKQFKTWEKYCVLESRVYNMVYLMISCDHLYTCGADEFPQHGRVQWNWPYHTCQYFEENMQSDAVFI